MTTPHLTGVGSENRTGAVHLFTCQKTSYLLIYGRPPSQNLKTGEPYTGRLAITGNHQLYLPTEIQKMLEDAGRIRIQLL